MSYSPILLLHICAGTVGVLSGFLAVFLGKGSARHRVAGNVFVLSMLVLGASGVYMAVLKSQTGNILGGTLTMYLSGTAWLTARHRNGEKSALDWAALMVAVTVGAIMVLYGLGKVTGLVSLKDGVPAGMNFFLGTVVLLAAAGDVRMLVRGISNKQRIARHVWRMCFSLFIAAASVFIARQHVFPAILRTTGALYFLSFLPLLLMMFWLTRVRFVHTQEKKHPGSSSVGFYQFKKRASVI